MCVGLELRPLHPHPCASSWAIPGPCVCSWALGKLEDVLQRLDVVTHVMVVANLQQQQQCSTQNGPST
jgi:hypothetical protein